MLIFRVTFSRYVFPCLFLPLNGLRVVAHQGNWWPGNLLKTPFLTITIATHSDSNRWNI